jgi:hypothetical protein
VRLFQIPSSVPRYVSDDVSTLSYLETGTIARLPRDLFGLEIAWRSAVPDRQIKFQPESVMADVYLGVTVTGLYTLVGMGLIIAFM